MRSYREKCLPTTPNDTHLSPNPPSVFPSLLPLSPPKTLGRHSCPSLCPLPTASALIPHPDPRSGVSCAPQALPHPGTGVQTPLPPWLWGVPRSGGGGTLSTRAPPQELGGGRDTQGSGGASLCRVSPSPGLQTPVRGRRALSPRSLGTADGEGRGCFRRAALGS